MVKGQGTVEADEIVVKDSSGYVIGYKKQYYKIPKENIQFEDPALNEKATHKYRSGGMYVSNGANMMLTGIGVATLGSIGAFVATQNLKISPAIPYILGATYIVSGVMALDGLSKIKKGGKILDAERR